MNAFTILILAAVVLALAGIALAAFATWHTRALAANMQNRMEITLADAEAQAASLRERLEALTIQIRELESQPSVTLTPGLPKPGMNVVKRAQALRLNRRGDPPEEIAVALELPRQEVDLLLKVHRIVMSNV